MANYDSNYAIAQEISARIGTSPIPFDSVYSIALEIYNELGGEPAEFDSVYSILLGILPLVEGGIASKVIDDNIIALNKTWSSSKINEEIQAVAGTANSDIEGKSTEDFHFVTELPQEAEEDEQVVIKGENADTLYKYVSGAWVEQTPDANKLYFDTENEALYSYVTAEQQFAPVSMVNTIVVGSNLNSNEALKAIKTPGVYSVVQRLHSTSKGDYIKNWTLTVEGIDYDEYERTDSIYQRIQSNYTIQKRTWSSTRATNDGWSSFSTYYAGEIKDTTTSKYYTWSSNKLTTELGAKQDTLTAGTNIDITDNTISAKGYVFDEAKGAFAEQYFDDDNNVIATNTATGIGSHAEGWGTSATGDWGSHTEGYGNTASGECSHAEGMNNTASGNYGSHAEGYGNTASSDCAHAEGGNNTASSYYTHAEGQHNTASGNSSHAEGANNTAGGTASHAEGWNTIAQNQTEHAEGQTNLSHKASDTYGDAGNTQHSVGIGAHPNRKNALEVMQNGDMYVLGVGGYQGTDTKVQDATVKTLQDVIGGLSLEAGQNIEIANNEIAAKGYFYDDEKKEELKAIDDILAEGGLPPGMSLGLKVSGAAGVTTYTYTDDMGGAFAQLIQYGMLPGVGGIYQTANGKNGVITSVDATTITFEETLDADNALTNEPVDYVVNISQLFSFAEGMYDYVENDMTTFGLTLSGAAGATTYTYPSGLSTMKPFCNMGTILKLQDNRSAKIISFDATNRTITFESTFDADNALVDEPVVLRLAKNNASGKYSHVEGGGGILGAVVVTNTAAGMGSHAEGIVSLASGEASHAEGGGTASGHYSHAEGSSTASGNYSHAEGGSSTASGEGSHAEGYYGVVAQNLSEHAEGTTNVSHKASQSYGNAGNTQHSVGIGGTGGGGGKNAFEIMQNGDAYLYGVGGYQGTNTKVQDATIKTLQEYIASLEARIAALEGN